MDTSDRRVAAIEIVERRPAAAIDPDDTGLGATVKPNEVRIDGVPYFVSAYEDVLVRTRNGQHDVVEVTLTLLARSVHIEQEPSDG